MPSPLPLRPAIDHTPRPETAVGIGDDESARLLDALASETARGVLVALSEGPAPASDLAESVGTSLQNVHYHLTNLREAGLVVDAGTWYSAKGKEMTVYAVACERLDLRIAHGGPGPQAAASTARPVVEGE